LPPEYPPYQTCHRRFQQRVKTSVFKHFSQDLCVRGGIDIREAFIDGTFVPAKKGACCRQDKAR
jgi:hypothetical protein